MDDATVLLEKLGGVLDAEQQVLVSAEHDRLDELLEKKQSLLGELAAIEPQLLDTLQSESGHAVDVVMHLLESCRQRNQENNALTVQGMKNIAHSISFLHSALQTGKVDLYDPSGKTAAGTAQRNIGRA